MSLARMIPLNKLRTAILEPLVYGSAQPKEGDSPPNSAGFV